MSDSKKANFQFHRVNPVNSKEEVRCPICLSFTPTDLGKCNECLYSIEDYKDEDFPLERVKALRIPESPHKVFNIKAKKVVGVAGNADDKSKDDEFWLAKFESFKECTVGICEDGDLVDSLSITKTWREWTDGQLLTQFPLSGESEALNKSHTTSGIESLEERLSLIAKTGYFSKHKNLAKLILLKLFYRKDRAYLNLLWDAVEVRHYRRGQPSLESKVEAINFGNDFHQEYIFSSLFWSLNAAKSTQEKKLFECFPKDILLPKLQSFEPEADALKAWNEIAIAAYGPENAKINVENPEYEKNIDLRLSRQVVLGEQPELSPEELQSKLCYSRLLFLYPTTIQFEIIENCNLDYLQAIAENYPFSENKIAYKKTYKRFKENNLPTEKLEDHANEFGKESVADTIEMARQNDDKSLILKLMKSSGYQPTEEVWESLTELMQEDAEFRMELLRDSYNYKVKPKITFSMLEAIDGRIDNEVKKLLFENMSESEEQCSEYFSWLVATIDSLDERGFDDVMYGFSKLQSIPNNWLINNLPPLSQIISNRRSWTSCPFTDWLLRVSLPDKEALEVLEYSGSEKIFEDLFAASIESEKVRYPRAFLSLLISLPGSDQFLTAERLKTLEDHKGNTSSGDLRMAISSVIKDYAAKGVEVEREPTPEELMAQEKAEMEKQRQEMEAQKRELEAQKRELEAEKQKAQQELETQKMQNEVEKKKNDAEKLTAWFQSEMAKIQAAHATDPTTMVAKMEELGAEYEKKMAEIMS